MRAEIEAAIQFLDRMEWEARGDAIEAENIKIELHGILGSLDKIDGEARVGTVVITRDEWMRNRPPQRESLLRAKAENAMTSLAEWARTAWGH